MQLSGMEKQPTSFEINFYCLNADSANVKLQHHLQAMTEYYPTHSNSNVFCPPLLNEA